MNRIEHINYIEKKVLDTFDGIKLKGKFFENQPNDAFILSFEKDGIQLTFVYDKGFINGEIIDGDKYIPYWKLDSSMSNLWLEGTENVDKIINYLSKHRRELFPRWK